MDAAAFSQVCEKLKDEVSRLPSSATIAILGKTPSAFELRARITAWGWERQFLGIYAGAGKAAAEKALADLVEDAPDVVVVASDERKEDLLMEALPYLRAETRLIIGGFRHFAFRDSVFDRETHAAFVPSFANGYPNSLIHIYQCLQNAARLNLQGVVAEFGMFKGGTTMLVSRFIEAFGRDWKVFGFDTFGGFPPPRSALDMYSHPDCVYLDIDNVRRFFAGRNVEIVQGDVTETVSILNDQDVVVAFVDTDNYTSATRILDVLAERMVVGGAIVFDHFTGRDRFLYTLGERIAAKRLLNDTRFFNLHDTGVFLRVQ